MADEIQISGRFSRNKLPDDPLVIDLDVNFDKTGDQKAGYVFTLSTTPTLLSILGMGAAGMCYFKNMEDPATSTITIHLRNGVGGADLVLLKPGRIALFPSATNTIYAYSSSGTPNLRVHIEED